MLELAEAYKGEGEEGLTDDVNHHEQKTEDGRREVRDDRERRAAEKRWRTLQATGCREPCQPKARLKGGSVQRTFDFPSWMV